MCQTEPEINQSKSSTRAALGIADTGNNPELLWPGDRTEHVHTEIAITLVYKSSSGGITWAH